MDQLKTKEDLLGKLRAYADPLESDDDIIRIKKMIEWYLLRCPELLYALNNKKLESELFNKDGSINAQYDEHGILEPLGEWDRYFEYTIKDFLFIPEVQTETDNFLCYTVSWEKAYSYKVDRVARIEFNALCASKPMQSDSVEVGIARHDLIGSIIRELFDFEDIFGTPCSLIENRERIMDSNYIARVLTFECTLLSSFNFEPYSKYHK